MANYVALQPLWHSKDERLVAKGETVDLAHLDEAGIARLVRVGAVSAPAVTVRESKPTKDKEG